MKNPKNFNNRIKEERLKLNFTQAQMAQRLGVPRNAISKYERGESSPTVDVLEKYSRIFKCSVDYLVNGVDKNIPLKLQFALRGLSLQEQDKAFELLGLITNILRTQNSGNAD